MAFGYNPEDAKPKYLLANGEYPGEILSVVEKTTKKGDPMLVITTKLYAKEKPMIDYIPASFGRAVKRLKGLCKAFDIPFDGNLEDPNVFVGKVVNCRIITEEDKTSQYSDRNAIAAYAKYELSDGAPPPEHVAPAEPSLETSIEIPF